MTFQKVGVNGGQIVFTGVSFQFINSDSSGYFPVISNKFIKNGSDANHLLTGDGGHKLVSDFVDLTTNDQIITGRKRYYTVGGGAYTNNSLQVAANDGNYPAMSFLRDGVGNGQLKFDGTQFVLTDYTGATLIPITANGFVKGGSSDSYVLTGGGGHKLISDFALSSQLVNYVSKNGDTLNGGGRINDTGNLFIQQNSTGSNATGLNWEKIDDSERIAGIGALTQSGILDYTYMGWGSSPWSSLTNLSVGETVFTYKGNNVWHGGNFNPNDYIPKTHPVYNISQFYIDQWETYWGYADNRNIRPSDTPTHKLQFGFTSWDNNNNFPYADYIHFGGYNDSSGGLQNLIMFKKDGFGLRQWQGTSQSTASYSAYVDYWHSGNFNPNLKVDALDSVTGLGKSGTDIYVAATTGNVFLASQSFVSNNYVPYTGANQPLNLGSQNLTTTGTITGFEYHGNIFASPIMAGTQVFNANNTNLLIFGNDTVPSLYYGSASSHYWFVGGVQVASINSGGLAVLGALSLNGYDVITTAQLGVSNGIATLDANGLVPTTQLPSYVDDVLEFANLASFPSTGETGKIYVALDTNLTYRWGGSSYTQIAAGAVQSVNGQTGVVNLSKTEVGLANIDNTSDATKNVLSATKWTTPRTLSYTGDVTGSASVDGSGNVGFAMTLANSGVSAGTYNSVNVDAKGRVLSGSNINYVTESYLTTFLQQNYFNQTASDERFVNTNGDEVINGNKTFTSSPTIPAATNGDHAVNLEQLTASLSSVIRDNDDFELLEVYRLIDSTHFDLDDTRVKKYNIVFEDSSNGSVNIISLRDNQYYQFSNVSGSGADLRISVEGYGMVDVISSGKTAVYMSWGGGKLLKISENDNISII